MKSTSMWTIMARSRMLSLNSCRAIILASLAFVTVMIVGCGSLVDMGRNEQVDPRRIYLNDAAANDSLPSTLATEGLLLVLQPGSKQYSLRATSGSSDDFLDFYVRNSSGGFAFQQSIPAVMQGSTATYSLQAPTTKVNADYYLVFLRGAQGSSVTVPTGVKFVPVDTSSATTVSVRLHMVRKLTGNNLTGDMMTETQKADYATAFHTELKSVFAAYGITVDASTAIVEPEEDPLTVTYNGESFTLPGTRLAGAINMYLVNSIEGGSPGSVVVGFAPREAIDLSSDENSRVLLNVKGTTDQFTIQGMARSMAVTAAHEMGHFLGMRHTSATLGDREYDDDESNRDDGFNTFFCSTLEKKSVGVAQEISVKGPGGHQYCLRVAGTSVDCRNVCVDRTNLMYPYKCDVVQKSMVTDQLTVLRNNLKIFKPL